MQMLRFPMRRAEVEEMRSKVEAFGQPAHNPVRDQIAELRRQRDAGVMTMTDYALTVAELLGAIEPGT